MTVPVSIGGEGPYRFIVDTGAERTVISSELARELELGPGRTATVHSMTEVSRIPTVVIPGLRIGRRTVNDIHAPALARRNLGAAGHARRRQPAARSAWSSISSAQEMTITPSRRARSAGPRARSSSPAARLYGRLVLVDAAVDGERVWVIIDTGSQVTSAKRAARAASRGTRRLGTLCPVELTSVTGGTVQAEYGVTRRIRIGGDRHPRPADRLRRRPSVPAAAS